jgi:hypothetical protein
VRVALYSPYQSSLKVRPLASKTHTACAGRDVLPEFLEHRHHAVHRTGRKSARPAKVRQRVVSAVQIAGPIDQQHHFSIDCFAHLDIVAGHAPAAARHPPCVEWPP